jgi:hypothetical protein
MTGPWDDDPTGDPISDIDRFFEMIRSSTNRKDTVPMSPPELARYVRLGVTSLREPGTEDAIKED